jgi:hypothetical protein
MKFTLWLGALALVASSLLTLSGCIGTSEIVGSGKLITQAYDYSQLSSTEFTMIAVENSIQVSIAPSDNFSVTITADDNVWRYLVITNEGYTLKLALDGNLTYRSVTVKVVITTPVLLGLSLSGGSAGAITNFNSSYNFSLRLTGGSQVTGNIIASDCQFDLSGGSTVQLSGSGDNMFITASDGSRLDLANFQVNDATVYLNKGSEATITTRGELSGKLLDGSHLFYYGNPTLGLVESSGGSAIENMVPASK